MSSRTFVVDLVGDEADTADVHPLEPVEPQHGGRDLPAEVGRDQHDAHVGGDHRVLGSLAGVQERRQLGLGGSLGVGSVLGPVGAVGVGDLGEAHRGDHGRVADGLELHVATVVGSLQLDDDEPAGLVEGEEVDPPAGVLPVAELLGDDEQILVERGDVVTEQALQVGPLVQAQGGERSRRPPLEPLLGHLVERHRPSRLGTGPTGGP